MTEFTIFIFRRDLRIVDNLGLLYATKNYDNIIPVFIFTPEQVTNKNKYKSDNAIQFMIESLKDLDEELKNNGSKLHLFYGDNISVIKKICNTIKVRAIIFNLDYTIYSQNRDDEIKKFCKKKNIICESVEDYLLLPIGSILNGSGNAYSVFTAFRNKLLKEKINEPTKLTQKMSSKLTKTSKLDEHGYIKYNINDDIAINGGRKNGLKYLNNLKNHKKYNDDRNDLAIPTTMLSAYIKFGCVSIREVYWKIKNTLGANNDLLSQLCWREFYYYIAYYNPEVLKGKSYSDEFDEIKWKWSNKNYQSWCNGKTGFPIVDACMIELNTTGFMHNRGRLIASNFLNRLLGMDWRHGEIYFAKLLIDYDPSVNNGNWQWIASTGTDTAPYWQRLFNPWTQSEKYDSDAEYIKKWLPNLKDIPSKELHQWDKYCDKYDLKKIEYIKPIIDYKNARQDSITMYKEAK